MRGKKVVEGMALLVSIMALSHCSQASGDDDDDAGDAGTGGASGGSTSNGGSSGTVGGSTAARGGSGTSGSGTGGSTPSGGSAGRGGQGGTGGAGGSVTGGTSGGGTPPVAGASACAMPEVVAVVGARPAAIDEATFLAQWPALMCTAIKPCCTVSGTAYDETKCLAYAATVFEGTELAYDGFQAAACLDGLKLASGSCGADLMTSGAPTACTLVYRGAGAHGSGCTRASDCAPDPRGPVVCDRFKSKCYVAIHGKVGDICNAGCDSASGLGVCYDVNPETETGVAVTCHADDGVRCTDVTADVPGAGTCQPAIPVGCACQDFLDDTLLCNGKGRCDTDAGVCVSRVGTGAPCRFNDQCAVDLYCPGTDGAVCTPKKHFGEACRYDSDCVGGTCDFEACGLDNGDTHEWFRDAYCDGVGT
jgi:hypothetical protein